MFKLTYFKATNLIGFKSGMGKSIVEIDLEQFRDKDIICVIGDNGSGKSTFLSLVHPWHQPVDGRVKFVIAGKEGVVIREYTGADGTVLLSKCIYKPKHNGDGHSASCYLEISRGEGDTTELNPSGNVTSYQSLLYTYFGVNKEYLSFAAFTSAVPGIVRMNDTERKSSVSTLIPNTKRFDIAFDIINGKHRDLRNLVRNVSQKILALRDEDSLVADLERVSKEVAEYTTAREKTLTTLSKAEGRLKEIVGKRDVDDIMREYNESSIVLSRADATLEECRRELHKLYYNMNIEPLSSDSIQFDGYKDISKKLSKARELHIRCESELNSTNEKKVSLTNELDTIYIELSKAETALASLDHEDIGQLEDLLVSYEDKLASLRYTKDPTKYDNMSYTEIMEFCDNVAKLDVMIQSLYEEYGELLAQYYDPDVDTDVLVGDIKTRHETIVANISSGTSKRDAMYQKIIELDQYRRYQDILNKRPAACTIDSCEFISTALKWANVADEVEALKRRYKESNIDLETLETSRVDAIKDLSLIDDTRILDTQISLMAPLIIKYTGISNITELYKAISTGRWGTILSIADLRDVAAILSEKDLYLKITQQLIPETKSTITLAKAYGQNRDYIKGQIDRLLDAKVSTKEALSKVKYDRHIYKERKESYRIKAEMWERIDELAQTYETTIREQVDTITKMDDMSEKIDRIHKYKDKIKECKVNVDELTDIISKRIPVRDSMRFDLNEIRRLHIEKEYLERDFVVLNVIRSIIQPGKGIRKELINIYMHDIYEIANQLLLNTFNGKLYLKEFIITDKEFVIPYVYDGTDGTDINVASSAQQSAITSALSLAILSKLIDKYGVYTGDEQDNTFSPKNKAVFIDILAKQMRMIGITQAFIISQTPTFYEPYDAAFLVFPGGELNTKNPDAIYL